MCLISSSYMLSCFSCVRLFATPWIIDCQAPLSMGFSRQEYWSRFLFPSPGDLPDPGIQTKFFCINIGRFFGSDGKASAYNVGDPGLKSLGQEDPLEKEMAIHSLQYSCLENAVDGGAWWATVHGNAKSQTRPSN